MSDSGLTDGVIYVNYGHADNAAEDLRMQNKAIKNILSQLNMELQALRTSWEGDDRAAYDDKQTAWDNAAQRMGDLVESNAALLDDVSAGFKQTERNLTQGWEGVNIGR
ncbi:WXG100 family type VII secretion target [Streptomyces sp. 3N207]|uniref:WXG100 family type VII secretion target n=1 Tax=Streptomyces sp. 3N207 TaxID=3457417 RepID=UPI003FD13D3D